MTKPTRQQLEAWEASLIERYNALTEDASDEETQNLLELIAMAQTALMQRGGA